jgi:hypothetical protein
VIRFLPSGRTVPPRRACSRRILWVALFAMAAALPSTPVSAGDPFDHPRTAAQAREALHSAMPGLDEVQVLRGRYSQRKFLREMPAPLLSSGEFLLVRDRGIWWHTQTPLDAEVALTVGETDPRSIAATTLLALFALDLDTLARSFDLFLVESGPHWLLGLRPRDASLAAWFTQITVSGELRVEQVNLLEATGDRTEIDLDAVPQALTSLTTTERKRLEP